MPEGKGLLFPAINSVNIDTPHVCVQDPKRIPVTDLRAAIAAFIDGVTNIAVEVNGEPIRHIRRVQSVVFAVALPEENVFDAPCTAAGLGEVPAGIYSPAVDDGFYRRLRPLEIGNHTLHVHAENPGQGFLLDVTYHLTVVPVVRDDEEDD